MDTEALSSIIGTLPYCIALYALSYLCDVVLTEGKVNERRSKEEI